MLSILIPLKNYNIKPLCDNLLSQVQQDKLPIEIIVCNDASNLYLEENKFLISHPGITYIKNNINLGRTKTRSNLAKKASNEWLLFLDADVLPVDKNFLKNYIKTIEKHPKTNIIYGGVAYKKNKPTKKENILRWVYGKKRESKSSEYRKSKKPNFIISQNLLIQKEFFLKLNTSTDNFYGLDNIFSIKIQQSNEKILHIDNNTYHLGLESSDKFIKKTVESIKTIYYYEKKGTISQADLPVQKCYLNLKKLQLISPIVLIYKILKPIILLNLKSFFPILILLDFHKLNTYILLKKHE